VGSRRRSSLGTVAALLVVHVLFLFAYGVQSKWSWATELVDVLASFTLVAVFFC